MCNVLTQVENLVFCCRPFPVVATRMHYINFKLRIFHTYYFTWVSRPVVCNYNPLTKINACFFTYNFFFTLNFSFRRRLCVFFFFTLNFSFRGDPVSDGFRIMATLNCVVSDVYATIISSLDLGIKQCILCVWGTAFTPSHFVSKKEFIASLLSLVINCM